MCAKKRNRDSKDYLRYLKDELSKQERHDLERDLQADAFEQEAMEGFESISPEKAEEDLLSLHASLNKRLSRRKRRTWYSIAATAASILLVGTIFLNIYDLNPDDAGSEPLTEETFRKLDSDDKTPEAKIAAEPEAQAQAQPPSEPEAQAQAQLPSEPESMVKPAVREEAPAPVAELAPENAIEEVEVDVQVQASAVMAEDEEILAVEATPERSKRSASKEKMAAPVAYEAEDAGAVQQTDGHISGEISGIVISSEDMEPIPGVTIMIQELNSGTVTDMEGRFIIPTDENQTTVLASFIGMETEEYVLQSEGDNELIMQPDAVMLDEIVVVSHLSGKVSGLSASSSSRTTSQEEKTQEETTLSYSAAEPPDSYNAYRNYLKENMVFPEGYIDGEREIVVLKFTVNSNGSISEISPLRSPGEAYTREASRLLLNGPEWKPAILNGEPMDEEVRIRIVFKK